MARPFAEVVPVKKLSFSGAVLLGMHVKIRSGGIREVQGGSERVAQFRIVWASTGDGGLQLFPLPNLASGTLRSQ